MLVEWSMWADAPSFTPGACARWGQVDLTSMAHDTWWNICLLTIPPPGGNRSHKISSISLIVSVFAWEEPSYDTLSQYMTLTRSWVLSMSSCFLPLHLWNYVIIYSSVPSRRRARESHELNHKFPVIILKFSPKYERSWYVTYSQAIYFYFSIFFLIPWTFSCSPLCGRKLLMLRWNMTYSQDLWFFEQFF